MAKNKKKLGKTKRNPVGFKSAWMCRKGGGARGAEGIELDESKLIELAVKICQSNPISTHGWVVAEIFSRQEHVDFAESRPVHGVDLPALEHQIVNLLRAHDRL